MYEPWVVADYYQWQFHNFASDSATMASQLSKEAQKVLQLQNALEPYDVKLFVCQVPSKDLICPEYLPENHDTRYDNEPKISAHVYAEEYNLGKAQLYSSTKHAEEAAKKLLESIDNILVKDAQVNVPITSFKIVSVNKTEIREVSDI